MRKIVVFMRKYVFISLIMLVAAFTTGCKDNSSPAYCTSEIVDLTVFPKDWQFDENELQFFCHCWMPEITWKVYDYGTWSVNREFYKGYDDAYQVRLPMSEYRHDTIGGTVYLYTHHLDYRVGPGYIDLQITDSDFPYPYDPATGKYDPSEFFPTDTMDFHIHLIY